MLDFISDPFLPFFFGCLPVFLRFIHDIRDFGFEGVILLTYLFFAEADEDFRIGRRWELPSESEFLSTLHYIVVLILHGSAVLLHLVHDLDPNARYFLQLLKLFACDNIDCSFGRSTRQVEGVVLVAEDAVFQA